MSVISDQFEQTIKQEIMARRSIKKRILFLITRSRLNIVLFTLATIAIALFIVAALLESKGTFTITTPRAAMINYGLVLSDTPGFERPRHELRSAPVIDMWNITQSDLPSDVDQIDGDHNGKDYLAYTFYVKNNGQKTVIYNASLSIDELHLAVDDAVRLKVYLNGEPSVHAKPQDSGQPEPNTIPFVNNVKMAAFGDRTMHVGDVDKYTVVLWLEGNDPQCVNDILGGFLKMSMFFDARPGDEVPTETPQEATAV